MDLGVYAIVHCGSPKWLNSKTSNGSKAERRQQFENRDEFLAADADGHTGVFRVPRQGILLRGSNRLISVHADVGATEATFVVQGLPPRREAPRVLGSMAIDPGAARYSQYDPQVTQVSALGTTLLFARYLVSFADTELGEQ